MCGILGLIATPWQSSCASALSALDSRGPDASQVLDLGEAALGHTRLAVIDLATGDQPMRSTDGRHAIVFNGEIYNFRELRQELVAAGRVFTTQSDTEVLLQGYAHWGESLLGRLDGMFAFAIWDAHERRLFAARDRIGIKPLFYSTVQGLAFASTLEPFFRIPAFPRRLDTEALRDYLAFQTVLAPQTWLRDVRQLPPASWLLFDAATRRLSTGRYWQIPLPRAAAPDRAEVVERVDRALAESVRRQLVADVPVGAFLSGGIDSGLMVHYMTQAGARPLETFTVRFAEAGYDETGEARALAEHFGAAHHVIDAPEISSDRFMAAVHTLDQPLADPAYVATYELSRLTRRQVTVAISGDGGDELFGGYPRFRDQAADHPDSLSRRLLRKLLSHGLAPAALLRRSLSGAELLRYRRVEVGPYPGTRKDLRRYLNDEAWRSCRPEQTLQLWSDLAEACGGMNSAGLMRADLWTYLSENCLVKTDRASMAHGLEVRVPMLGNPVLDAVLTLPSAAHFDPEGKVVLRALARRYLPEAVWNRPKHGFSVPLSSYLRGPWREICEDHFARAEALAPFLDSHAVSALWRHAQAGRASQRLAYTLAVLLIWLDRHMMTA